jgi:CO/xanthine dehydrogenase Mo-binding subunit
MDAAVQLRDAVLAEAASAPRDDADGSVPTPDWAGCAPRTVIGRHESAAPTFGFGMHLALVRIDPENADVAVERLAVAYDCGRAIDLDSVRGQLVGAAVQGLGGTLLQELSFDAGGQPQSTTFMDFLVPTLAESPRVETVVVELPGTTSNPLGVKGAGEAGIMGVGGAVSNAVSAALGAPGAVTRLPVHPDALLPFLAERPAPPARAAASPPATSPPAAPADVTAMSSLRHRTAVSAALSCGVALCALAAVRLLRRASHRPHG